MRTLDSTCTSCQKEYSSFDPIEGKNGKCYTCISNSNGVKTMTDLECFLQLINKMKFVEGLEQAKNDLPSYNEYTDNDVSSNTKIKRIIAIGLGNRMYHEYHFNPTTGELIWSDVMYF